MESIISSRRRELQAFSLVELLAVIAILGIMTALAIGPVRDSLTGHQITAAGNEISSIIEQGRSLATTTQKIAVIRFYQDPADSAYRWVSLLTVEPTYTGDTPPAAKAKAAPANLKDGLKISTNNSTLLTNGGVVSGTGRLQNKNLSYKEFYIYPDGSSSLATSTINPYLTIVSKTDETNLKNPFVISLDPVTTRVTTYRR